jgi:hypothetical protein
VANEEAAGALAVFVQAGPGLYAFDCAQVVRLALADEVTAQVRRPGERSRRIQLGDTWYATANLLDLLGAPGPAPALVLMRLTDGLHVALGVTACLKVGPLPALSSVPPSLWRARGAGVRGAFPARRLADSVPVVVGLALDLGLLLTRDERAAMAATLASSVDDAWGAATP